MAIYDFFYDVSITEKSGFGVWYEYMVKYRIFRLFKDSKKVLVFGLPERYSLGLDTLSFATNSELHIVDTNMDFLKNYKKFADMFNKKVKIIHVDDLKKTEFLKKNKYDLLVSAEVLQNDTTLFKIMKEFSEDIVIFVPNKQCYAHPRISHENSLSINELKKLGGENKLILIKSGYLDCPPWPAGAMLPRQKGKESDESIFLKFAKKVLVKVTPFLTIFDSYHISPWKELNSHIVFGIFKNMNLTNIKK